MTSRELRAKLKAGQPVFGTWNHIPNLQVVEVIGAAGLDFIVFDLEHGPHSFSDMPALYCAAEASGLVPVTRVPGTESSAILRTLDSGAKGVMVPHVENLQRARDCLDSMVYGTSARNRGVATLTRSSRFNTRGEQALLGSQNEQILSVLMIEETGGLADLDAICALPGLDVVFVGIYDLSQSLGLRGGFDHPEFERVFADAVERIKAAGIAVGCYAADAAAAKRLLGRGITFITLCVDGAVLRRSYESMLEGVRS
ncbi:4-hydroxy-2-oxoheptanedioate aldolase [uncultured Gammaproteobacteria bacterium]